MIITEDYVSFEIAKLLKGNGFDDFTCHSYFYKNGDIEEETRYEGDFGRPTLQMAAKWLRVVHKIDLCVFPCYYDYCLYGYECKIYKNKELLCSLGRFKAYEEAMDAALLLVLNKDNNII